jgi:hypothetical protein
VLFNAGEQQAVAGQEYESTLTQLQLQKSLAFQEQQKQQLCLWQRTLLNVIT